MITLEKLTGLDDKDLADVFSKNPRAYMAVKGAVAEKHLELLLKSYCRDGRIAGFRAASGDFEKDFYVTLNSNQEVSLECKNVQVLNTKTKGVLPEYISFLVDSGYLEEEWLLDSFKSLTQKGLVPENTVDSLQGLLEAIRKGKAKISTEFYKCLPQEYRESGVPRYEFSASLVKESNVNNIHTDTFISQFDSHQLSIDFQRTRNSTDEDGDTKKQRFYRVDEIDVVGACLFSRTMKWQFIFGHSKHFEKHPTYEDRYTNRFFIEEGKWSSDLLESLN
ncbi:hypothetical protein [Pseudobacteriovorax antillogorgiicola]|uniref:Uncharacterized protein n=2 Tax=Pseudobacteriovorax antillogorgiicola TaxID=1513793 RepID=A0A1Y6CNR2_9BACT|nr:hypothetical protein [Pseudobacteriovorax antillogorgiicola]TCS44203.1 hypothetical protein EDD56_1343 [Pseudobacteriovorax antillogorgiicola]SMF80374.1 hypothetical protein SAMN06296036_1354 [Pseudobacteriovorax antillogorgiicola]